MSELTEEYLKADKIGISHVYIIVGVPRCGKTTKVNQLLKCSNHTPVCRDDIRRAMGVRFKLEIEPEVYKMEEIFLSSLLIRGVNIIIDETNETREKRKRIIDLINKYDGIYSFIVLNQPPLEELKKRCEQTNYPFEVLEQFINRYEDVGDDELCNKVILDRYGKIIPQLTRL